ncbi:MAG: bifunctional phosphoribosylaminoimidazolecarboxamide formyltransferase/IMP cyclohydrolase [Deltaproteobacteria bacterium]|nr:bifunctional phosphoribosylaminoimidazolecarboxamide formyltransferase/IMP cyclohydrolase [Deltaproteobacteria bacterium]
MSDIKIKRALISVSKKDKILQLASALINHGVEILSTGNTAELLKKEGIPVVKVSDYTGYPEILEGRVKTLNPKIHGGILGRRNVAKHVQEMEKQGIPPIDLVVVNLYPFERSIAQENCTLQNAIENVDIGGPTLIRAAAKNFESVAVVVDPADYSEVIELLEIKEGRLSLDFRFQLSKKAFSHTAAYDDAISNYLTRITSPAEQQTPSLETFPNVFNIQAKKTLNLRYGENPHQKAAFYQTGKSKEPCVAQSTVLHGKELSFNNLLDLEAALETVKEFQVPACVIVKHNNPCGAAIGNSLKEAYQKAFACDPSSAFGGIVAVNRVVDLELAEEIVKIFYECIIAPDYDSRALDLLRASKKNLRILKTPSVSQWNADRLDIRKIAGGLLVQERDLGQINLDNCRVVTERSPTPAELSALDLAWKVAKHVKSNAIIFATNDRTVGIGAGQMSRIDSVRIGVLKSFQGVAGTAMASDAFFPFRDNVDEAAKAGVKAIIQPGGSIKDEEVIRAANEHQLTMLFTGMRHFRH